MGAIKTLNEYIEDHADNITLSNAAGAILLKIQNKPKADGIFVIDESIDLSSLEKGYYLRFLDRGRGIFHVYGVEVLSKGDVIVHENIPRNALNKHSDFLFKEQLLTLHQQGRIYFRVAKTSGGGMDLHEDLALHYAESGSIGVYVNSRLGYGDKLPKRKEFKKEEPTASLQRFIDAQNGTSTFPNFSTALNEIKNNGKKTGHWIWYIFPQLQGLIDSPSDTSKYYSLKDLNEACHYLQHKTLLKNYLTILEAVKLQLITKKKPIQTLMGGDDKKLISSLTLFSCAASELIHENTRKEEDIYKLKVICDELLNTLKSECKKTLSLLNRPSIINSKKTNANSQSETNSIINEELMTIGGLIDELDQYIKTRENEWSYHYNFLGIVAIIYFIQDFFCGTDYFNVKSKQEKINAATHLKEYLIAPNDKPNLTYTEIQSLKDGRLGHLVNQYVKITEEEDNLLIQRNVP